MIIFHSDNNKKGEKLRMHVGNIRAYISEQLKIYNLNTFETYEVDDTSFRISGYWIAQLEHQFFSAAPQRIFVSSIKSDNWVKGAVGLFDKSDKEKIDYGVTCNLTDEHKSVETIIHNLDVYPDDPEIIGLKNERHYSCFLYIKTGYSQSIIHINKNTKSDSLNNLLFAIGDMAYAIAKTSKDKQLMEYIKPISMR